jgi:two-component system chemotaxis response regulator CheY
MNVKTVAGPSKQPQKADVKNILIVDDLPMMRVIIKNNLSQLGVPYPCIEAEDGIEALRCLAKSKVALIFLDWIMPNLSGIDFLKKIRALKLDIPIIMVTGESDRASVKEALQAGVADYIVKPITQEVLKEKLVKLRFIKG